MVFAFAIKPDVFNGLFTGYRFCILSDLRRVLCCAAHGAELSEEQRRSYPDRPDPDPHRQPRRHAGRILQQPG